MSEIKNCRKIADLISEAANKLKDFSENPRLDAEILLAKVLGTDRFGLFAKTCETAGDEKCRLFDSFVGRRMNFEPVAYITNEKEFFEDLFFVDERVLIPRPEKSPVL